MSGRSEGEVLGQRELNRALLERQGRGCLGSTPDDRLRRADADRRDVRF
jgi:hypothetical protein